MNNGRALVKRLKQVVKGSDWYKDDAPWAPIKINGKMYTFTYYHY